MFCINCGGKIRGKVKFCPHCGAQIPENALENSDPASKSALRKKTLIITCISLFAIAIIAGIVLIVANSPANRAKRQLAQAEKYMGAFNYDKAAASYQAAIKIDPKNADAYLGLSKAYCELDEMEEAIEVLKDGYDLTDSKSLLRQLQKLEDPESASAKGTSKEKSGAKDDKEKIRYISKETVYDANGTISYVNEYNESGDLTKYTYYDDDGSIGGWWELQYNDLGNEIKRTEYDSAGAVDRYSELTYDDSGKLLKEIYYNGKGRMINSYEYYGNGQLKENTWYNGDGTIASLERYNQQNYNVIFKYGEGKVIYDTQGRVIKTTDDDYDTWTEYEYDEAENIIKKTTYCYNKYSDTYYVSEWTELEYDKMNNPVKTVYYDGDEVSSRREYEYKYDAKGFVIWRKLLVYDYDNTCKQEECSYDYDDQGNCLKKITSYYDGSKEECEWEYNSKGRLITEKIKHYYPDGSLKKDEENVWKQTALDFLDGVRDLEYDSDGNIDYGYDTEGNIVYWYSDGVIESKTVYEFDEMGNPIKTTEYDADGNVTDMYTTVYEYYKH